MRVLLVSQEVPPETGWGGIGTYVACGARALASRGHEVHVLSVVEGQAASSRTIDGVTIHRRPLIVVRRPARIAPQAWPRLWLSLAVAHFVERMRPAPDVVECPDWKAEGLGLSYRGRFPLVVRLHSTARQIFQYSRQGQELSGADGQLAMWFEETAVRRANVVVSTRSNFEAGALSMRLDERAAHFIAPSVRLPDQRPHPPAGWPPRVVYVGRLEPRKAPDVLLQAVPHVLTRIPEARFVFVGRTVGDEGAPSSGTSLQREADRLDVGHAVEFRGGLDWHGVAEEVTRASVCAFPSRWECFPNVVAEAAALGRPVVASSIYGHREMVQDGVTGALVPHEAPEAWADAIVAMLADRERARALGEAGARLIRKLTDPDLLVGQVIRSYEHAIERFNRGERAGAPGRKTLWRSQPA